MRYTKLLASIIFFGLFFCSAQENQKLDSLKKKYLSASADTVRAALLLELYSETIYNDAEQAKKYAFETLKLSKKINSKYYSTTSYYELSNYYMNIERYDSAQYYLGKSLKGYQDLKIEQGIGTSYHSYAIIEYYLGNYDAAIDYINKAIKVLETVTESEYLAGSYDLKGTIMIDQGYSDIALKEILKGVKLMENLDNPYGLADLYLSLGEAETKLKYYESSITSTKKSKQVYNDHNDVYFEAISDNNIGTNYYHLKQYDSALIYLNTCIPKLKSVKPSMHATALNTLGKIYHEQGEYQKSLSTLLESKRIIDDGININKSIENLNELGKLHNTLKQYDKALIYLNEAVKSSDSIKTMNLLSETLKTRYKSLKGLKRYHEAVLDQERFHEIYTSLFNQSLSRQIEELRTIYDTEKKEQQLLIKQKEITVLEQRASIGNLQRVLMGIGLLLSIIGFYALRQKMKRNKLEKEKIAAELAFKKKELTTHALNLARKNEVLETVKQKAVALKLENNNKGYRDLIRTINFDQQDDRNWKNFIQYFEQVHKDFSANIKRKFPEITSNELRLLALLKMNLSSKEIANILNISGEGVKKARYRLRKKLGLATEDSLQDLVLSL